MSADDVAIVVPTIGRPSLDRLVDRLGGIDVPIVVVDDRPGAPAPLTLSRRPRNLRVLQGRAAGPAAARNIGWRACRAEWIAFLDDDVEPCPGWFEALRRDLDRASADVGGIQGRVAVPLPRHRRPTDRERDVAGLATARWVTADMAYRRTALEQVGGFDERFARAYREDADIAARVRAQGWRLVSGQRRVVHPVAPADRWISVRRQRGNADDVVLRITHGRRWRRVTDAGSGRRARHVAITGLGVLALGAALAGRPRLALRAGALWMVGTAEFAWARIAPGPRTLDEVATMVATSVVIPPAATAHWLRGWVVHAGRRDPRVPRPSAVLFDRDGTLIVDVPYNGDARRVEPMPGARAALERLRAAGIPLAVVSNQSGIGRGLITPEQVDAVNRRTDDLVGPVDVWLYCPHEAADGCDCRKPRDGLLRRAARVLDVDPAGLAVIGDIEADMQAASAVGARAILVPNGATRTEEVATAVEVASDLSRAVDMLLGRDAS